MRRLTAEQETSDGGAGCGPAARLVTALRAARGSARGIQRSPCQELADRSGRPFRKARPGSRKMPPVERREASVPIARDARRLASAWCIGRCTEGDLASPLRLPALHSPHGGNGKRDTARPPPQNRARRSVGLAGIENEGSGIGFRDGRLRAPGGRRVRTQAWRCSGTAGCW